MYWDQHRLIDPTGRVIGKGKAAQMEDLFARTIEREGFPVRSSYTLQCIRTARHKDDMRGPGRTRPYTVLGCDRDGWWALDGSGVVETSGPARRITEIPTARGGALLP